MVKDKILKHTGLSFCIIIYCDFFFKSCTMILNDDDGLFFLRPWQESDAESLAQHADNINIARNLTDQFPHPYTLENARSYIQQVQNEDPPRIFAIVSKGQAIGGIGIHPQSDIMCKNAELGYWLGEKYWGRGITRKAIQLIVDYTFQMFDFDRIFARPFGSNTASQKVLEKNGFVLEARFEKTIFKHGRYEDELVYAVRKDHWQPQNKPL